MCRTFSVMVFFLVCLFLTVHAVLCGAPADVLSIQTQGPTWEAELWCDLSEGSADEGKGTDCGPTRSGNSSLQKNITQCHVRRSRGLPASYNNSSSARVVWLNILCWIDENLENLICNFKRSSSQPHVSRLSMSLQRLPSGLFDADTVPESAKPSACAGDGVLTCSAALDALDGVVSLRVSVSSCTGLLQSPAMRILLQDLLLLEPPVNLQYNMTTEGKVRVSWTVPHLHNRRSSCEVRYSANAPPWVTVAAGVSRSEVDLSDLRPGFNYSVQVRCQTVNRSNTWSNWSRPLYIYLHEVSYLPERVFASTGSNVTVHCIFNNQSLRARNVVWWLNYHQKIPESQYGIVNERVSSVTLLWVTPPKRRGYDVLHCCQRRGEKSLCSYPYAQIYVTDFNIAISCETNGDLSSMTCRWNASRWAEVTFRYRRDNMPCDVVEEEESVALTEACPLEGRGSNRCTLQPLLLASCYLMWLEVKKDEGIVKSRPTYVTPMELVRPHPPFDLRAVTVPDGVLKVRWKRNELPAYNLQYEVRYAMEDSDTQWKVVGPVFNESAVVPVSEPCVLYIVQVRCRHSEGPGYWSEWSRPCNSTVQNFKAPEQGPDFWRVLQEDPEWNHANVTLLLKPLPREKRLFCVESLEIHHQTHGGTMWTERVGFVSQYSFVWSEEVHTVTILAVNSLGSSTRNTHMTLSRHRKLSSVQTFSSVALNRSCVALSWRLFPRSTTPTSFVIEWHARSRPRERNNPQAISWVRVPATVRAFDFHDAFYTLEDYQFILFPIFVNGEGEPVYSRDDGTRPRGEHAAFMLLMIIAFLCVVLFVMLSVSQRRYKPSVTIRKLVWTDVPNPNNCSWAQGVDFKKVGAIENLFQHPEQPTSHPLLLESEMISEAVIVEKAVPLMWANSQECPGQASCGDQGSLQGVESPVVPSCEGSGQSRITYAAVLLFKQQESVSNSSDEGNFSANLSDISGSFRGAVWELENGSSCQAHLRHSCSYNSEEFSDSSEPEEEAREGRGAARSLCYLRMTSQEEGDEEERKEEEEVSIRFLQDDPGGPSSGEQQELPVESSPLLGRQESSCDWSDMEVSTVPLYMPQFRTSPLKVQGPMAHGQPPQGSRQL